MVHRINERTNEHVFTLQTITDLKTTISLFLSSISGNPIFPFLPQLLDSPLIFFFILSLFITQSFLPLLPFSLSCFYNTCFFFHFLLGSRFDCLCSNPFSLISRDYALNARICIDSYFLMLAANGSSI
ncbi:hypothetical protein Csa_001743 [Cucumis sativus]|uniref:Uncharacterized protein n=1 Tax=Cucumis sativus TaxID=3659 RepID=A0A0A0LD69_CUCSA|nr:hypothetical protein Csa_001743 [Cucumis sativus]